MQYKLKEQYKISITLCWFFERINKTGKPLLKLTKRKEKNPK
jgi:hypothetical protein